MCPFHLCTVGVFGCALFPDFYTMCLHPLPHILTSITGSERLLNRFCDLQIGPFNNVCSWTVGALDVSDAEANILDRMCVGVLKNAPQERSLEPVTRQSVNEEQEEAASMPATIRHGGLGEEGEQASGCGRWGRKQRGCGFCSGTHPTGDCLALWEAHLLQGCWRHGWLESGGHKFKCTGLNKTLYVRLTEAENSMAQAKENSKETVKPKWGRFWEW